MALIRELTGTVQMAAPDAPEPVVNKAYVDAARQFFTDTRAWREATDRVQRTTSVRPGVGTFSVTPPLDTESFDLLVVHYDELRLKKVTVAAMSGLTEGNFGCPGMFAARKNTFEVAQDPGPGPAVEALLSATMCLRPTREAAELDDDIADRFGEMIEFGAIARLLSQPRQEWTDLNTSMLYRMQFEDYINTWRSKAADDGQIGVGRRVRYGGL